MYGAPASLTIGAALTQIGQRIEIMRASTSKLNGQEAEDVARQLDQMQEKLHEQQQIFTKAKQLPAPQAFTPEKVFELYDIAQSKLDEAYARTSRLDNPQEALKQLNQAQARLDRAREEFESKMQSTN